MSTELVLTLIKQEVLILAMLIKSILQVKKRLMEIYWKLVNNIYLMFVKIAPIYINIG